MRRGWILGVMAAVGLGSLVAAAYHGSVLQQRGEPAGNATQQPGIIAGNVRNPYTNEPVDSVNVSLIPTAAARGAQGRGRGTGSARQVVTDGNGRFTFTNVDQGNYTVRAEREGYFSATVNLTSAGVVSRPTNAQAAVSVNAPSILMNAQSASNVALQLIPGGSIRGPVYDRSGRLLPNAAVRALRESYQDGHIVFASVGRNERTDDRGEFRFWGLAPDRYYLLAEARPAGSENVSVAYYPAEAVAGRAQPLTLQSGNEIAADIHLASVTPLKVSGNIVGASSPTANAIQYALVPRDSEVWDNGDVTRSNSFRGRGALPNNAFELQAQSPGRYDVFATMAAGSGVLDSAAFAGRVSVDVMDRDIDGLTLTLKPTFSLQIRFVGNDDPELRNQILSPISLRSRDLLPSSLTPRDETLAAQTAARTGRTAEAAPNPADGHMFSGVTEGRYVVESGLQSLRDAYIADIRQGPKSLYEDGTIVVGTDPPLPVEIVLARPAAVIQGVVQDATGKPVGPSLVVLIPDGRRRENPLLYKKVTTLADGQFTLRALAPGQYKIFAWENLPTGAERNAQFLARFEPFGRSVNLSAGSTLSSVSVPLIRDRQ